MAVSTSRRRLLFGLAAVAVVGLYGRRALSPRPPSVHELKGTRLVALDAAARTAEIEFINPKNGRIERLPGVVPPHCALFVDGKPATLSDLRIGDIADVTGRIEYGLLSAKTTPLKVLVRRTAAATSTPATQSQPATAPTTAPASADEPR